MLVACLHGVHGVLELLLLPLEALLMRKKLLVKRRRKKLIGRVDSQDAPDCVGIRQPTVASSRGDAVVRELTLGLPFQHGPVVGRAVRLARARMRALRRPIVCVIVVHSWRTRRLSVRLGLLGHRPTDHVCRCSDREAVHDD